MQIPVSRPSLGQLERDLVAEALARERLSMGEYVARFQFNFARWLLPSNPGAIRALACSSGTTALHLALLARDVGRGAEVIVPASTFVATANAVAYCGATPVLVDIDPDTWTIDPSAIAKAYRTGITVGVIPVHLYGVPCDMDAILAMASRCGIFVLEDCAEAIGTYRYADDKHVGLFGYAGVFSFYGNKTLTTGEGGMIVMGDDLRATFVERLRGQGMRPDVRYFHDRLGYNYRMTDLQGALGVAQVSRADALVRRRNALVQRYRNGLSQIGLRIQTAPPAWHVGWWHAAFMAETVDQKRRIVTRLAEHGIDTRPAFVALCDLPMYYKNRDLFPNAVALGERGVVLPCYDAMTEADVDTVLTLISEVVA